MVPVQVMVPFSLWRFRALDTGVAQRHITSTVNNGIKNTGSTNEISSSNLVVFVLHLKHKKIMCLRDEVVDEKR